MKKARCFRCKKRDYTVHNCSRKEKIAAISNVVYKNKKNKKKKLALSKIDENN